MEASVFNTPSLYNKIVSAQFLKEETYLKLEIVNKNEKYFLRNSSHMQNIANFG